MGLLLIFMGNSQFSILSWNIREALIKDGKIVTSTLVRGHKPKNICLFKKHCQFSKVKAFWLKLGWWLYCSRGTRSHGRGIWVLVDSNRDFSLFINSQHQSISFLISKDSISWVCSTLYVRHVAALRDQLWLWLQQIRFAIDSPWLVLKDFSEVAYPFEVRRGIFN